MTSPSSKQDEGSTSSLLLRLSEQNQLAFPSQPCSMSGTGNSPLKQSYSLNDILKKVSFIKEPADDVDESNGPTALDVSRRNHNLSQEKVPESGNQVKASSSESEYETVDIADSDSSPSPPVPTTEEDTSSETEDMRLRSSATTESPKVREAEPSQLTLEESTTAAQVELPVIRTTRKSTRVLPNQSKPPVRPDITRAQKKSRSGSGDDSLSEAPQKKQAVEPKPVTPKPATRSSRATATTPKTPKTPALSTPKRTTKRTKAQLPVVSDDEDHQESTLASPDPALAVKIPRVSSIQNKSKTSKVKLPQSGRKSTKKAILVAQPQEEEESESDLDDPARVRTPSPRFFLWPEENP